MILGLFIAFPGAYVCSTQVELKIATKNKVTRTFITAYKCFGKKTPEINQDVECLIRYEVGPTLYFKANVKEFSPDSTALLHITSPMSRENVVQLLSTIAKLK